MLALERRGIMSSFGLRVKTALPLEIGRAFITGLIISILCNKSVEKRSLLSKVSNDLNTLILDSTKFENCSLPPLGLISQPGQGLFVATETKVACASVMISSG